MKELWNTAQVIFAAIGGWLGYFLGGCDGLLIALVVFVAVDYVTGVMCAISDKKLSSEVGFKGICRKVLIFLLVGIANILDVQVIGTGSVLRTAVIFFYLSNEGVSLLEIFCGGNYTARIIPKDINIWISRLFLGDADGFSILYYQDVDSLVYWANQAAYRWKLRGMCMWSLGQEDMRLWEWLPKQI